MLLKRLRTASLKEPTTTRDSTAYMYFGFRYTGLDSPKKITVLFGIWTCYTLFFNIFYMPFGFIINYVFFFDKLTPVEFMTSLQLCVDACGFSCKILIAYIFGDCLKKALLLMDELDKSCKTKNEFLNIRKCVALCNKVYALYVFLYTSYLFSTCIGAVINNIPPFNMYFPFINWRNSYAQFLMQSFIEFLTVGCAICQVSTTDSFSVLFVIMLRTHVKLLTNRITNLGTDDTIDIERRHQELINCIKDHKILLRYADIIRPMLSYTIFTQFVVCGSVIGLAVINLMFFANLTSGIGTITFVICVPNQTMPLCFFCNCLIDDCNDLVNAIFHSRWVDTDQRYKKTLLYFMHKTQQPITFAAFNIFPINLSTNLAAIKFAFTVYTMADTMNLSEKYTN